MELPGAARVQRLGTILAFRFQPFAQAGIFGQPVGDNVDAVVQLAAIDDAVPLILRQCVELGKEERRVIGEKVHKHRSAGGDFARVVRARAFVMFQIE